MTASYDEKKLPVLYTLMRNDLNSLNCGKAIAQGNHAGTKFAFRAATLLCQPRLEPETVISQKIKQWLGATNDGFGTSLTIECDPKQIEAVVEFAQRLSLDFCMSGLVIDPTYPVPDGKPPEPNRVVHYIPTLTCAYVFGYKDELAPLLGRFGLYP